MEIKFSRSITIPLVALQLLSILFGPFILKSIWVNFDPSFDSLSLNDFIVNLAFSLATFLPTLIIGFALFWISRKVNKEPWSWLLIGFTFGQLAILAFAIELIITKPKNALTSNHFIGLMILLIFATAMISFSSVTSAYYLTHFQDIKTYAQIKELSTYVIYFRYLLTFVTNVVLAFWTSNYIRHSKVSGIWIFFTIILGLIPVGLLMAIPKHKQSSKLKENEILDEFAT